jgi:hypothetical protein
VVNYESLSPEQLQALIDDDIRHVAVIIGSQVFGVSFRWIQLTQGISM